MTKLDTIARDLADRMADALEVGAANPDGWVAPWHGAAFWTASNAKTRKQYQGGNALVLGLYEYLGAIGPWATYRQWKDLGGQVRKGEHGTVIVVPRPMRKEQEDGTVKEWVSFGAATVFHSGQQDGWEMPELPTVGRAENELAAAWVTRMSDMFTIQWTREARAYYDPATDYLSLPTRDMYPDPNRFYSTCWHEAGHATGHSSRLDRPTENKFGSPGYAQEELVAEFTAAIMGNVFGIETGLAAHNRDYLANWHQAVKKDPMILWDAAGAAHKAAKWLVEHNPVDAAAAA